MSDRNTARRTAVEIAFDGVDVTESIRPYLKSFVYTDNEEDKADDIQIQLQDRDSVWLESWLNQAIEGAAAANLNIDCVMIQKNWQGGGQDFLLPCGQCELDTVEYATPPSVITIKGTALPFSSKIRQTPKDRVWENISLNAIVRETAKINGMKCLIETVRNPFYERVEQIGDSDIQFLARLCRSAGIALKSTNQMIVLFDQAAYEANAAVMTIQKGDGSYEKCKLTVSTANNQYASCRVRYVDPDTGGCIEGIAKIPDYQENSKNNQQLEIRAKADSQSQAEALARQQLRLHNKYFKTAFFTMSGNPALAAGSAIRLKGWGAFDGKYMISQAKHTVNSAGYVTQISLRKILEGFS